MLSCPWVLASRMTAGTNSVCLPCSCWPSWPQLLITDSAARGIARRCRITAIMVNILKFSQSLRGDFCEPRNKSARFTFFSRRAKLRYYLPARVSLQPTRTQHLESYRGFTPRSFTLRIRGCTYCLGAPVGHHPRNVRLRNARLYECKKTQTRTRSC
jgi:hypothetical protein